MYECSSLTLQYIAESNSTRMFPLFISIAVLATPKLSFVQCDLLIMHEENEGPGIEYVASVINI